MEYPIRIKPTDGNLIRILRSNADKIEVREGEGVRWMHFGDDAIQAMMIMDEPYMPIIPYQIYMLAVLLFNPAPNFALNLGVGGGSFERFFAHYLPELMVTSVESNQEVIGLLHDYFSVSACIPVINEVAETYLSDCTTCYDLILCDLFDHSGRCSCAHDREFYANAFRCLSSDGVFAINLLPDTESEMVDILLAVRSSFDHVILVEIPNYKNILLFCLRKAAPETELLEQRCARLAESVGIDLADIMDLMVPLPRKQT